LRSARKKLTEALRHHRALQNQGEECHSALPPAPGAPRRHRAARRQSTRALPGVGHKTANVILNTIFHEPVIAVDTHIFRVSNRTGLAPGKDVKAVEAKLLESVPDEFRLHAHHWLILLGRYTCKARKPECGRCPINDLCEYPDKVL